MAKTLVELLEEIKKLPPNERIKKLLDLRKNVKEAIEKRQKELEEAEKIAESAVVEIGKDEDEKKREAEFAVRQIQPAVTPAPPEDEVSLEEMVAAEKPAEAEAPVDYGKIVDEIKTTLYDIAPAIYQGMKELRNKASEEDFTEEDKKRFESYNEMMDQISTLNIGYMRNKETRENLLKMQYAMRETETYSTKKTEGGY